MTVYDLSILIPARNEMFLARTVEDILANIEANTEIIVVEDGGWSTPGIPQHERVTIIYHPESVGQRAATNGAAKLSRAKYVMKCDAHCAFDKGFDRKMLEMIAGHDDWTVAPLMRNLHAFDWVCTDGHRRYQSPSGPCRDCGKETVRDVVWVAKENPRSVSYCFDSTPHFQYFGEFSKRPEGQGGVTQSMSLQGSCFMMTLEKYWELGVCDEAFGGWGSQGIEVAAKTWLSGGEVMINKNTWYAHMFRTQGGDFGFPYPMPSSDQERAKAFARDLFFNNRWPLQKRPLSWLVEKFWPVRGWTEEDLKKLKENTFRFEATTQSQPESEPMEEPSSPSKGIIFYTDNEADEAITEPVQERLIKISQEKEMPIVTSARKYKLDFGAKNICFPRLKRGRLSQFRQILAALKASTADIIFFCEAEVLYHPSHFDFVPPEKEIYYYNVNIWKVRWSDGHALKVDELKQLSGLVGYRDFLIRHYEKRIAMVMKRRRDQRKAGLSIVNDGVSRSMGLPPGMQGKKRGVEEYLTASWQSACPNLDIRHDRNISKSGWRKEDFRDQRLTQGWTESTADDIPGWEGVFSRLKIERPAKGIIYYSDCQLEEKIAFPVREQIEKNSREKGIPIVSATLKKMNFGAKNIHFPSLKRGYLAMAKQIKAALEHSTARVIFFCEHDVLYHPSHFDFNPEDRNIFYYNQNVWYLRTSDGHALHYDVNQLSGLCGYRDQLYIHFKERLERIEKDGFSRKMGFEPMTHGRVKWDSMYKCGTWKSKGPNVDIRHPGNVTGQRWRKSQFRNKKLLKGWKESDRYIPGWGRTKDLLERLS